MSDLNNVVTIVHGLFANGNNYEEIEGVVNNLLPTEIYKPWLKQLEEEYKKKPPQPRDLDKILEEIPEIISSFHEQLELIVQMQESGDLQSKYCYTLAFNSLTNSMIRAIYGQKFIDWANTYLN